MLQRRLLLSFCTQLWLGALAWSQVSDPGPTQKTKRESSSQFDDNFGNAQPKVIKAPRNMTMLELARGYYADHGGHYSSPDAFAKDLTAWNSHLNPDEIWEGSEVYLQYPYSPHTGLSYAPDLFNAPRPRFFDHGSTLGAIYSLSKGTLNERSSNGNEIEFEQNSPVTIGMYYGHTPLKALTLRGSSYIAKLVANSDGQQSLGPPLEMGTNAYLQHNIFFSSAWFGGLDYERFSTFDVRNVTNASNIHVQQQTIAYATLGLSHAFMFGNQKRLTMLGSYSYGFMNKNDFAGDKFIVSLGLSSSQSRFHYNLFYKQHLLSSDYSKLNIIRIGLGIGYRFL